MNGWIVVGIVLAIVVLGVVAQRVGFIDLRDKSRSGRSGGTGGMFGAIDEIFAPTRHEAQQELDRQTILPIPAPVPGDGDNGISPISARPSDHDSTHGADGKYADGKYVDGKYSEGKYSGSVKIDLSGQ